MNDEIKKFVFTSVFLALCGALVIYQIPIFSFYSLDFSFVALLISRKFVGIRNSTIISLIFPWFAMIGNNTSGWVGPLTLVYMSFTLLWIEFIFNKNKTTIIGCVFTITIWIFTALIGDITIFWPLYQGGWIKFYDQKFSIIIVLIAENLAFNLAKALIMIVAAEIIYTQIKKVI